MERLIHAKLEPGKVAIHWLGQGGFAFRGHMGPIFAVDPYLSDSVNSDGTCPRLADVPVKPKDVKLDYLFLTHDHLDHTDPFTAPVIAQNNPNATVICPPESTRHLTKLGVDPRQMRTVTAGHTVELDHLTVHVVSADHTEDSVGFVFIFHGSSADQSNPVVYITGDTEYGENLASNVSAFDPDVLLVPINGKLGNMNATQAAQLTVEILPLEVIPMHFGMFESNTVDPQEFLSAFKAMAPDDASIDPIVMKHNTCHIFGGTQTEHGRKAKKAARAERAKRARVSHEHISEHRASSPHSRR